MNEHYVRKQNGYTLFEMMISMFIFLIIVLIVFNVLDRSLKMCKKITDANELARQQMYLTDRVGGRIKCAGAIVQPAQGESGDVLELTVRKYNPDGSYKTDNVKYYLMGDTLVEDINNNKDKLTVSEKMKSISFSQITRGKIELTYSFEINNGTRMTPTTLSGKDLFESIVIIY